jgi:SAM-dependent methyltransferase
MRTEIAAPEVIELTDPEPARVWQDYHRSGMLDLIGSHYLCQSLYAAERAGIARKLRQKEWVSEDELLADVDRHFGRHLLRYLAVRGVLRQKGENPESHGLTPRGRLLLDDIPLAQLGFYLEAYGPVVQNLDGLLQGSVRYGTDVLRDGGALGRHCATLFHQFHTPIVLKALEGVQARSILDLGCGGGRFLVDACQQNPELRGIGLDISPGAIEFARELAAREGLSHRLRFEVADAFRPETWPSYCREAEALCAIGMLHESFRDGEQAVIDILNVYADFLAHGVKSFILGEPELHYDELDNDPELFLIHIFTMQGFPRRKELWLELFEKTKLRCRRMLVRTNAGPRFAFYDLVPA